MGAVLGLAGIGILDETAISIAALLLLSAFLILFRPTLVGVLAQLPVVGGWVADRVDVLLIAAAAGAAAPARAAIHPLQWFLDRAWAATFGNWDHLMHVLDQTYNVVNWVSNYKLPLMITQTIMLAQAYITQVYDYVRLLVTQTIMLARLYFTQSLMYTDARVGAEDQVMRQAVSGALAYAQAAVTAEDAAMHQAFTLALTHTDDVALQLDHEVRLAYAQATAYADSLASQLERVIAADVDAVAREIGSTSQADRAAAAAAVAAASAATAAATGTVADRVQAIEDSPCMQACSQLGELGQLLQGIEAGGLVAILLGLITQAESDPAGLANELQESIVNPLHDIIATLGYTGRAA